MILRANETAACVIDTPIGRLRVSEGESGLVSAQFVDSLAPSAPAGRYLSEACRQLEEYFSGARRAFTVPLSPAGTPFRQRVWGALLAIPFGETRSYRDIAAQIGQPAACRAVGGANRANPLCLFIPCHRVIAADGGLGGYAFGLDRKRFLLALEAQYHG